jgi:hypothetical protein
MKRSDQEQLLKAVIGGEELDALRDASMHSGLQCLRQRRRRRSLARVGLIAVMPALIAIAILWPRPPEPDQVSPPEVVASVDSTSVETASRVQMISDEELLALFPGRPVALIGKIGNQRLIFLDQE